MTYLATEGNNQTIFADAHKPSDSMQILKGVSDVRAATYISVNGLLQERETCRPRVHLNCSTKHGQALLVKLLVTTA
jgi:hypothetical protein